MQKAGFVLGDPVKLLQLVKDIITGAYSGNLSFQALAQEIIQGHLLVKDLDYELFVKRVTGIMVSDGLLLDNQAAKITATCLTGRCAEGGVEALKSSEFADPWFGDINLDELSSKAQMTSTNCLCCRHQYNHVKNHHMPNCDRLKKMGYTAWYDQAKDKRLSINQPSNKAKKDAAARKAGIEKARKTALNKAKETLTIPENPAATPPTGTTTATAEAGDARCTRFDTGAAEEGDFHFGSFTNVHNIRDTSLLITSSTSHNMIK